MRSHFVAVLIVFLSMIARAQDPDPSHSVSAGKIEIKEIAMKSVLELPCSCDPHSRFDGRHPVALIIDNPDDLPLNYHYEVTSGRIVGAGREVIWDVSGLSPGEYMITARVDDGVGTFSNGVARTVTAVEPDCHCRCSCPSIVVYSHKTQVRRGNKLDFEAWIRGGFAENIDYHWTVTNGEIISGQGTPVIEVLAKPKTSAAEVIAKLEVTLDVDCGCPKTVIESVPIGKETKKRSLPPDLDVRLGNYAVHIDCDVRDLPPDERGRKSEDAVIDVFAGSRSDSENDGLLFDYKVTGGNILGSGPRVKWDLTGALPGTYNISAAVTHRRGSKELMSATVTVADRECGGDISCPSLSVAQPVRIRESDDYIVRAISAGGSDLTYVWTVSGGQILAGQGTNSVRVRAKWSASDPTPAVDLRILVPEEFRSVCTESKSVFLRSPSPL